MRLKMLPKKGDLRDLNNWRGIMLLDAASELRNRTAFQAGGVVRMGASAFDKR